MDYEKEYKKLKAGIRNAYLYAQTDSTKAVLENILPELAESEDERTRKGMIDEIKAILRGEDLGFPPQDVLESRLAYLEKQKEPQHAIRVTKSFGDPDGPQFELVDLQGEQKQEWSEEDEKKVAQYLHDRDGGMLWSKATEITRDILDMLRPQPKAELTLLDENIINAAVAFVEKNDHFNCWGGIDKRTVIKALHSLKPSWKPSEQEKGALKTAIHVLTEERNFPKAAGYLQAILDAFDGKEARKEWKPSEEHLSALLAIFNDPNNIGSQTCQLALTDLYEQLKRLM